ncbi:DNA mismatch repair protein [Coemansia thaxteri]|uniref:DNA mismatch repair protein n=1 Tax=Coemansia thaxteri TaxID=2663907 RepID=A0A9W8BI26_9FUNG|nr:DNA mismatch repair protein [Coemansia thaxteri]KAJ2009872.1 DNA mismatch repair protein [Coemansia thaxteri]KAJ2474495.1 DNA mismatch repair protein [Coemansia sp. RSA 2322]KAJ2485653.1 DNA mismatch repair protein [Coemansia sp. RSA 2320]
MSSEYAKRKPAPIRKLEESVINRIAAGEIINRPSNALKELLENSLDAGATSISIGVKDGGMKLLQIQDNGHGIRTEDLPLVCERFTTSKLKVYEDLSTIQTYGFRGEALASISHVSHLSITTKQADSECAYKANYADGKIVPAKPGGTCEPEPCAGNDGTILVAEDLFYSIPSRKTALKNTREEYNRIFEVASRYAIHNSGVAFTCRKIGAPKADLSTPQGASIITNIRQVFGAKIASSLVEIEHSDGHFDFRFKGLVSSASHEMHKSVFLLFINHRLVDHGPIKRAVESLYTSVLPKASRPFVYLDLQIKPENVDVNVHPTKREVRFLNEDSVVAAIVDCIHKKLMSSSSSKTFEVQSVPEDKARADLCRGISTLSSMSSSTTDSAPTPLLATPTRTPSKGPDKGVFQFAKPSLSSNLSGSLSSFQKTPVNKAVRTDYKTLTLESFSFGASPSIRRNLVQSTIEPDFSVSPAQATTPRREPLRISPSHANRIVESTRADPDMDNVLASGPLVQPPLQTAGLSENIEPLFSSRSTGDDASCSTRAESITGAAASEPSASLLGRQLSDEFPSLSATVVPAPPDPAPAPTPVEKSYMSSQKEPRVEVRLTSILNLRKELQRHAHAELTQIFSEHTFVGFVDNRRALIQHQTRLYMVDYCKVSYHLMFHRCLFDFMNFGRLVLQPPPSIYDLALVAAFEMGHANPAQCANEVHSRFSDSREMLEEYFHIKVSDVGTIDTLPMLVRDYSPDYDKLPLLLYNATFSVNWDDEQQFFKSFGNVLAAFYSLEPPLANDPQSATDEYRLMVEHRIMPSLKGSSFWAPTSLLTENALVQLVDLPDLYRIFERC